MKFDARGCFLLGLLAAVVAVGCQSFPGLVGRKQVPESQLAAGQSTRPAGCDACQRVGSRPGNLSRQLH